MDFICKKIGEHAGTSSDTAALQDEAPVIICRSCLGMISRPEFAVEINHAFAHTFANPTGTVFEVGCFSRADGCVKFSDTSGEFTWFTGYVWAVGLCRTCRAQLGWIFLPIRSGDMSKFYGLILDQLIFP